MSRSVVSRSVLIIDDSLTVRMDLGHCFESAGYLVYLASTLSQAREILGQSQIDGIVLDVILPDGNGVDFLEEVSDLVAPRPPILMLSSEAEVQSRLRGLRAGVEEYVGKPYNRDYVVVRMAELLIPQGSRPATNHILIVDDSRSVREKLGVMLGEAGFEVVAASTGEEGLRLAGLRPPCLLIVDSLLPGIDGCEVIRQFRLDSTLRSIPCLMLTGSEPEAPETRFLDAGADAFLRKSELDPFLLARVRALLRGAGEPLGLSSKTLGRSRILAVDDSPTFLNSLIVGLSGEGYDLVKAGSGEEALEIVEAQEVDCILLDHLMPGIGGEETCVQMKSSQKTRDIPLILLSELKDQKSILRGLAAGADDYIPKSAEFEILRARIRSQLRRKQIQDEKRSIHAELLERRLASAEAKAAKDLAEARAALIGKLEEKNEQLEQAYRELQATQVQLVHAAKMASLGQLVAGLAHEINNPIAYASSNLDTVLGWLEQISPQVLGALNPDTLERWERIQKRVSSASQGVERVAELVRKLRTFSRLDEGEFKNIDLEETLESVLSFLEHRLSNRIEIRKEYDESDGRLDCYASSLNQVFMNLLVNAIDAIESSGGCGTITLAFCSEGQKVRISVADTGPGLPSGAESKLFEPFFTTKPVGHGTGLGLSISFAIVQAHHGKIQARNLPKGGCEFVVEIPKDLQQRIHQVGGQEISQVTTPPPKEYY